MSTPKEDQDALGEFVRSLGVAREDAEVGAFAVDLNNEIVGDPYFEGTGYFSDRETAEAVAALLLPTLDAEAATVASEQPENDGESWVVSWATVVSLARTEGEEPEEEYVYDGDAWFAVSVELGMLDDDQKRRAEKVRVVVENRKA